MKKVLILFGSKSSEHEVSCISAYNILKAIDHSKYHVTTVGIDKKGYWFEYFGDIALINQCKWLQDTQYIRKITDVFRYLKGFDVVFPVLHGKYGEDGTIQGILEFVQVPYVGCGVLASSIAMDKTMCKKILNNEHIPVVDYVTIQRANWLSLEANKEELDLYIERLKEKLNFPMFVKPNSEGSSYGISKVENEEELLVAIKLAFSFDDSVLIEKFIEKKQEIECAVIQKRNEILVATPGEIVVNNDIYTYQEKYIHTSSYSRIPAHITSEQNKTICEYAKKIFKILQLTSLARIDFFVSGDDIYFNEVNTMPGFTPISMFPKMLMHDEYSYHKIIEILIEEAINKENWLLKQ